MKVLKGFKAFPRKAKVIIALLVLLIALGGVTVSLEVYDFTQNDPTFCNSCHLMKTAYQKWEKSEHQKVNCHECHYLPVSEQNVLLMKTLFLNLKTVSKRHGKVIVSWKICIKCHWEKDKRYPEAGGINQSHLHGKHIFYEKIECSKCHGYKLHQFTPEARFCVKCHKSKVVHGSEMKDIACLNCHTDRQQNLLPERKKCLFCHGDSSVRKELTLQDQGHELKHYHPSKEKIEKAIKVNIPSDAPMRFACHHCHQPHKKIRPGNSQCIACHTGITESGKHANHVQKLGMNCAVCHKPHSWKASGIDSRKTCSSCHSYRNPSQFMTHDEHRKLAPPRNPSFSQKKSRVTKTGDAGVRSLYEKKCGGCHGLYSPKSYSKEKWRGEVMRMSAMSSLSKEEEKRLVELWDGWQDK